MEVFKRNFLLNLLEKNIWIYYIKGMLFKKNKIKLNKGDIGEKAQIISHLNNLSLTSKILKNKNDLKQEFKLGEFSEERDFVDLISLGEIRGIHEDHILTVEYMYENKRYKFSQRISSINNKTGIVKLYFPKVIRNNERRKFKRYKFPEKEEIYTILIPNFSKGVGLSGPLNNLCEQGGAIDVAKMVDVNSQKEIKISKHLAKPQKLSLIRFKLPTGPQLELNGELIHSTFIKISLRAGFKFNKLNTKEKTIIDLFLNKKFG